MITASYHDDDDLLRYFYFRFSGVLKAFIALTTVLRYRADCDYYFEYL